MPALPSSLTQLTYALVALALIVTGLVLGKHLFIPLALGAIIAFVLAPPMHWLVKKGINSGAAIGLLMVATISTFAGASVSLTNQIASAVTTVGDNQANILAKVGWLLRSGATDSTLAKAKASLDRLQGRIESEISKQSGTTEVAKPASPSSTTPSSMSSSGDATKSSPISALGAFVDPLATAALTILFASFLLAGQGDLRDRLVRIAGVDNISTTSAALSDVGSTLSQLFLAQLIVNGGFGAFVAVALWMIGLPNAALWGLSAGILRFVPYVGAAIAAVPPLLLAASVEPGWTTLLMTLSVFLLIEPVVGHVIEPLVVGKAVGISPIAMLLSAAFWTMLWGPVGLLLSAPFTASLVVLGQHVSSLRLFNIAFADTPPLPVDVRMYHRLLSGDEHDLLAEIKSDAPPHERIDWVDQTIIPGLQLAAADHDLGRLDSTQMERIQETSEAIASMLSESREGAASDELAIVAARGAVDHAAATTISGIFGAEGIANDKVGVRALQEIARAQKRPLKVVIATVGGADPGQVSAMLRRAQALLPQSTLIECDLSGHGSRKFGSTEGVSRRAHAKVSTLRELADLLGASKVPAPAPIPAPIEAALAKLGADQSAAGAQPQTVAAS